jgi:hypothetical protein
VFCNHRETCDEVADALANAGFAAVALHGGMEQHDRNTVLLLLRNGSLRVVVATDVAARGLDIDDLDAIINYDLPREPDVFVHRIGRTAPIAAGSRSACIHRMAGSSAGRPCRLRLAGISALLASGFVVGIVPARRAVIARVRRRSLDPLEAQGEVQAALALLLERTDRVGRLVAHDHAGPRRGEGGGAGFLRATCAGPAGLRRSRVEGAAKHLRRECVLVAAWRREADRELVLASPAADLVRGAIEGCSRRETPAGWAVVSARARRGCRGLGCACPTLEPT